MPLFRPGAIIVPESEGFLHMDRMLPRCTPEEAGIASKTLENLLDALEDTGTEMHGLMTVSYTHLDVYKRQASLLAHYLQQIGVGCYVLSGDNYPRRIPAQNDAERLRLSLIHIFK